LEEGKKQIKKKWKRDKSKRRLNGGWKTTSLGHNSSMRPFLIHVQPVNGRASGKPIAGLQHRCYGVVAFVGKYENKTDRDWLFLDSCYFSREEKITGV
jgi:hypothetical protein